jgi:Mrp family chromosome partitioning ATPase/capsular polysaccharide biosynthesis protein
MHQQPEFPLRRYLRFLQRQGLLVVLVPALVIAVAAAVTFTQKSIYRGTMKLVVVQAGGERQPEFGSEVLSQTIATLLKSDAVASEVIRNQHLDATTKDVLKDLNVTFGPNSAVLNVSYDSSSKKVALTMLGEFSRVFERQVNRKLGVRSGGGALRRPSSLPVITVSVFDPPHLLSEPVAPKPVKNIGFAAALGLALGILLAFARENLDDRVRDRRQAEDWFGAPVVGTLPKGARGKGPLALGGSSPSAARLKEALQLLRARIEFSRSGDQATTILVTSALTDEGKSTVVANLAAALAIGGKRVICVEADMRRPTLHRYVGLQPPETGLLDVLTGNNNAEDALRPIELGDPRLDGAVRRERVNETGGVPRRGHLLLLPAGGIAADPAALLTDEAVADLIRQLRTNADYIIFDSPPLLGLPDSIQLALHADKVLVVARRGRTRKDNAEAVRATLDDLGVQSVGVVVTDAAEEHGYGYGYG